MIYKTWQLFYYVRDFFDFKGGLVGNVYVTEGNF